MRKKIFGIFDSKPFRATLIIIGIILVVYGPIMYSDGSTEHQQALDALRGQLRSPYKIDPSQPVYVELGGSGSNFSIQELANGLDLTKLIRIDIGNETVQFPIQISFGSDGNIHVSAKIRNAKNAVIAEVVDNEWKSPSPDSMDIWDRNYNSYAFEVIDSNKIPILQVIMGGQNEILVGCSLYAQGIPLFATLTHGLNFFFNGDITATELQDLREATIFKYPSKDHLGEMQSIPSRDLGIPQSTNQEYPVDNPLSSSYWKIWGGIILAIFGGIITTFVTVDAIRNRK